LRPLWLESHIPARFSFARWPLDLYSKPMTEFAGPTLELLHAKGDAQAIFHQQAVSVTRSRFGRAVFVRAVVEISNYCREDCVYCGMRRSNRGLHRFRAEHEQLGELLVHHRPSS